MIFWRRGAEAGPLAGWTKLTLPCSRISSISLTFILLREFECGVRRIPATSRDLTPPTRAPTSYGEVSEVLQYGWAGSYL